MTVRLDRAARRDLARLASSDAVTVLEAIDAFAERGVGDVLKLQGRNPPEWRLRVGRYRVLFRREVSGITIFAVRDRKDAYR